MKTKTVERLVVVVAFILAVGGLHIWTTGVRIWAEQNVRIAR